MLQGGASESNGTRINLLVGGDVSLDPEPKYSRYVGVYRKRQNSPSTGVLDRIGHKLQMRFLSDVRRRHMMLRNMEAIELLIKIPENAALAQEREARHALSISDNRDRAVKGDGYEYPFARIAELLRAKDFVMANLETPLADCHTRMHGIFRSEPGYARAMAAAGFSLVNLANNHIFDAGESGMMQTVAHVEEAGMRHSGFGIDLEQARRGTELELKGLKLIVLGYTQYCNVRYSSIVGNYPGVLPLDRQVVIEDIKRARRHADLVFVHVHWGIEDQPEVTRKSIELAHLFIDAGADAIVGHHPHIPHGIEIYKRRPILYSLGNFIFGIYESSWTDNYVVDIVVDQGQIRELVIYPIAGKGGELFQPYLLNGERAHAVLGALRSRSAPFNTSVMIEDNLGRIEMG